MCVDFMLGVYIMWFVEKMETYFKQSTSPFVMLFGRCGL